MKTLMMTILLSMSSLVYADLPMVVCVENPRTRDAADQMTEQMDRRVKALAAHYHVAMDDIALSAPSVGVVALCVTMSKKP